MHVGGGEGVDVVQEGPEGHGLNEFSEAGWPVEVHEEFEGDPLVGP